MRKIKTIKLPTFKMYYWEGGYACGVVLKRHISFSEAEFIANNILGINTSLTWNDYLEEEKELELKQNDLVYDITQLITGNVGFDYISRAWANGDALECLNIAIFFDLFIYLIEEGII